MKTVLDPHIRFLIGVPKISMFKDEIQEIYFNTDSRFE